MTVREKPDPVAAGFDPNRLSRAAELLNQGVERGLYPGGVLWVSRKGITSLLCPAGHIDFGRTEAVDESTLFDLASLTKPVATASAMLILCQEGRICFSQPVADFFPGRGLPHLAGVTLRHLLTHTSGLPPWKDLYSKGQSRDQATEELFSIPLDHEPGAAYAYSCMGYMMLSMVIEAVAGEGLDEFARKRLFEPLGMCDTTFTPAVGETRRVAATDHCPLRKRKLVGEVHDGNAHAFGGVSGNAGLFSTVSDLARFCAAIGFSDGAGRQSPFGPAALKVMFANALPRQIGGQTIGWFIHPNDMLPGGDLVSRAAIGHSGFTGTAVVIDPEYDLCLVLLTNRVCREDDGTGFRHLRRTICNAVLGSIVC